MQLYRMKCISRGSKAEVFVIADTYQDVQRLIDEDKLKVLDLKLVAERHGSKSILLDMRKP